MEFFHNLGTVISERWKARNYNEDVFSEIASRALAELPPAQHVSPWDVVRWAMSADQLPRQDDIEARFGNPPLTVYAGRKFRIEVLFWTQGLPAIHQHGFSGAFHVMTGSSIHTLWEFQSMERVETRLLIGKVLFKESEILLQGDCRPILAGNAMFHSTYHLDRPSISVVVRTLFELDKDPQYTLLPPGIAYDAQHDIATVRRQTQLLQMLATADRRTELNQIMRHMCATKDAYSIFMFLLAALHLIEDETERQDLLLTAKLKHRHLVEALEPALNHHIVGSRILRLHDRATDADLRFLLALLRNVPERTRIFRHVEQRIPDQAAPTTIASWIRRLSASGVLPLRFEEPVLLLIERLLMDHSATDIVQAMVERYGHRAPGISALDELCSTLKASWLLRFLFPTNPFAAGAVVPGTNATVGDVPKRAQPDNTLDAGRPSLASYQCILDTQPDPLVPRTLRSRRVINGHSWIVNPRLGFSQSGRCLDSSICFPQGVESAEPMAWVTDPVTSVVSPFVLGPSLAPVVASLRPGHALPEPLAPEVMQRMTEGGLLYEPDTNEMERRAWLTSLQRSRAEFEHGYVSLGAVLHPFTLSATRTHFRRLIQQGGAHYGDTQVPRRWAAHNEPVARFILHQLTTVVEAVAGVPIKPSYVYFASYYDGAKLARHTDREQCEYSISMLIDYSPEPEAQSAWPLWLDTTTGPVAIHQRVGDTLIYRGRELPHYREELPAGHTSTHLFLHYVPRDFAGTLD